VSRAYVHLFVVGFGRPDLLREQHRLLAKFLTDPYTLTVLDNTLDPGAAHLMRATADELGVSYEVVVSDKHEHTDALNRAATLAQERGHRYWGCLDHDVMPYRKTRVVDQIRQAGFLGLGQTYSPRVGQPLRYLWPGWVFFSSVWLNGRTPNFNGIRGEFRFDDGDAGSMMHSLFTDADWERQPVVEHSYDVIRDDDGHGLQSFGFERIGDFVHLSNASRWKAVPDPDIRESLLREMLEAL
jgi:hypothetical protein